MCMIYSAQTQLIDSVSWAIILSSPNKLQEYFSDFNPEGHVSRRLILST